LHRSRKRSCTRSRSGVETFLSGPQKIRANVTRASPSSVCLIDRTDARLADVETRDAAEPPGIFREPDEVIDTLSAVCEMPAVEILNR
jgi:hypothetical protein